ncbi:ISL3 family transposase [Desulfosporosinus sp. BG]|uniref:ISL3 family transposase n=1 Tax=Desulfosporosinus sp. BG TaxID=1633135 RepID=UPI00083AB778|nr:ISL3 family transposase [Desulfosporosinus sp. BG]ODA39301.1 Mobile element protein [Desulfosporosinus sp. BG]
MNVLELEEFNIIKEFRSEQYNKYVVEPIDKPTFCSKCGSIFKENAKLKVHDVRTRKVADQDIRGMKVIIEIKQRRFYCPECGDTFTEIFKSIAPDDRITVRLRDCLGKESIKGNTSFASLADQYGVSESTVKRSFEIHVAKLDAQRVLVAPRILGIDEIYVHIKGEHRKQPCAVFTDVEKGKPIEFVRGITKELVVQKIKEMKGYENIEVVTMDMASAYRNAVEETIPKAFCVIDRFHVMQKFNMKVDVLRASIQSKASEGARKELFRVKYAIRSNRENLNKNEQIQQLDGVLEKYPSLKEAYWAKEGLKDVYNAKTKYDAYQLYYQWETSISKGNKVGKEMQKLVNKLKKEVFAYFDGHWTNAYTESFNNVIRRIVRLGNGYSYDTLRAKVIFGSDKAEPLKAKNMQFYEVDAITGKRIFVTD